MPGAPIAVHSSDTSQQSSRPSAGRPRAMHSAEYPVNVPTSIARARADQPREQREERALLGRDLHAGHRAERARSPRSARAAPRRAACRGRRGTSASSAVSRNDFGAIGPRPSRQAYSRAAGIRPLLTRVSGTRVRSAQLSASATRLGGPCGPTTGEATGGSGNAASLAAAVLDEEAARQEAQARAKEQVIFPDDLLPGVNSEPVNFKRGVRQGRRH